MTDGCAADGKPSPETEKSSTPSKEVMDGKDDKQVQEPISPIVHPGWSRKTKLVAAMLIIFILQTESTWDLAMLLFSDVRNVTLSTCCVFQRWFSQQYMLAGGSNHDQILRKSAMSSVAKDTCKMSNQTVFETEFIQSKGWCADHEQGIVVPDFLMIVYLASDALGQGVIDMGMMAFGALVFVLTCITNSIFMVLRTAASFTITLLFTVLIIKLVFAGVRNLGFVSQIASFLMKGTWQKKEPKPSPSSPQNSDESGNESDASNAKQPNGKCKGSTSPIISFLRALGVFVDGFDDDEDDKSCVVSSKDHGVKLSDYKGASDAKKELELVVDFLKNPQRYHDIGARLPHGVLLYGPPGTGKTLFARALAGEAGVKIILKCASEFRNMFVGSGARNIRQTFDTARRMAPCILFIDEIDSISKRTSSSHHPYANQAINQILYEMDGFVQNKANIIVVGATNRLDNIDKALLRPGRFDKTVFVGYPDCKAREEILEHYIGRLKKVGEIDVDKIASKTNEYSGAELENLINQAAITAVVKGAEKVEHEHVEAALDEGKNSKKKMEEYDSVNHRPNNQEAISHMYN